MDAPVERLNLFSRILMSNSVSVSFEDGKSRIVRLANESSSTTSPSPSALEKQKVLRTVSATTTAPPRAGLYGALDPGSALKIPPVSLFACAFSLIKYLDVGGGRCCISDARTGPVLVARFLLFIYD